MKLPHINRIMKQEMEDFNTPFKSIHIQNLHLCTAAVKEMKEVPLPSLTLKINEKSKKQLFNLLKYS